MKQLLGWSLRIVGVILWIFLIVMFKNDNPGWTSDAARFWFYAVTSLGGLACFGGAQAMLGDTPPKVVVAVGVIVPADREDS